ncbi:MAG TPA: alanine racemase [Solirubrobacterales bacterium]|nr:alanine racemase [Solirubrobacterales bacterium]
MTHPAVHTGRWAEVDLDAIRHNVRFLRERLPAATRLVAVVKGQAYGHGATPVARTALDAGAWGVGVATLAEAEELQGLCAGERLLLLGGLAPCQAAEAARVGCAVACGSEELAAALAEAGGADRPVPVHLKVDTGMGRLGCAPGEAAELARRIQSAGGLQLAGIFTHFASAESDEEFTAAQFTRFQSTLAHLDGGAGLRHACNSAAALRYPAMALDAVRCGIALYGCEWPGLRPALRLCALVTHVKRVPAGAGIGYGQTWHAERDSVIATIGIGYEDGVLRSRSSRGDVVVRGRRAPLVGRVSMDQITIDVTDVPGVQAGDVATLIGDGITAEEVGEWSGTNCYEVLTSIGSRVERVYTSA